MTNHDTQVQPIFHGGDRRRHIPWQAVCACGWKGDEHRNVADALVDADRHDRQEQK